MPKFDQLIKEGKDVEAVFYLAEELYNSGKIGGTRKMLIERIAHRVSILDQRNKRISEASVKDIANRDGTIRAMQERIDRLESEIIHLKPRSERKGKPFEYTVLRVDEYKDGDIICREKYDKVHVISKNKGLNIDIGDYVLTVLQTCGCCLHGVMNLTKTYEIDENTND